MADGRGAVAFDARENVIEHAKPEPAIVVEAAITDQQPAGVTRVTVDESSESQSDVTHPESDEEYARTNLDGESMVRNRDSLSPSVDRVIEPRRAILTPAPTRDPSRRASTPAPQRRPSMNSVM